MTAAEPYCKTELVPKALGVSASAIKRWVDSATIKAARTAGKHRVIRMSNALRVARDEGVDAANVEVLGGLGRARVPQIDDRSRDLLFDLCWSAITRQLVLREMGWQVRNLGINLCPPHKRCRPWCCSAGRNVLSF
jgi:hypothetical protein